jgi:predicted permease
MQNVLTIADVFPSIRNNHMWTHDLRLALRSLYQRPAFSLAVIGMLGLGIGGNTAIFSIFNGLFLRAMPFPHSERLMDIDEKAPRWNLKYVSVADPDLFAWREQNRTFEGIAAYDDRSFNLSGRGDPRRVRGLAVTHDFAAVLGIPPLRGRMISPDEDKPNGPRVALLGYRLWQDQFGGDANIVGQVLQLDERPVTVVGILPPHARFPSAAELWVPLQADPASGGSWWMNAVGRLKPGVTQQQALADLERIHKAAIPTRKVNAITSPVITPLRERILGQYQDTAAALLGAVGVVLLIACVNVAALMLVRGQTRSHELAVRAALGASRRRLFTHMLVEIVALTAAGGLLGMALGYAGLRGILAMLPDVLPDWITFETDLRFLAFCVAVTGGAALLAGVAPSLHAARLNVAGSLHDSGQRSSLSGGRRRTLSVLVTSEVALATVLLIGAGLTAATFRAVLRVDPGFRPDHVLTFQLSLPQAKYAKPEQVRQFFGDLLERLRGLPGVKAAGATNIAPLGGHSGTFFQVEGARPLAPGEQDPVVLQVFATPGYFDAIGISFLAGRPFTEADGAGPDSTTVIVNETFAKRFWPNADPIGKRIKYRGDKAQWMPVAGVMRDVKHYGLDQEMRPNVYLPHRFFSRGQMTVVMRTGNDPQAMVSAARDTVRGLDPALPMFRITTMKEQLDRSLWSRRVTAWLFGVFAGVAVALTLGGVYGVLSYAVAQRQREIGIRMALGAQPGHVLGHVLRQGMTMVVAGIVAGLGATLALARAAEALLFQVSARDPLTYAAVVAGLVTVAFLANLAPARRAAAVDPMRTLRAE